MLLAGIGRNDGGRPVDKIETHVCQERFDFNTGLWYSEITLLEASILESLANPFP